MQEITITRPDDFHLHLRDGAQLASVVGHSARQFGRAIIMPNLKPPVVTTDQALAYRQRILAALPAGSGFNPLMTLYLTDNTAADEITALAQSQFVHAVKYYPAGATTNADLGVSAVEKTYPVLERMAELSVPLLVHGEVTDRDVDIFDREQIFIEKILAPLMQRFPGLPVVFEHITTAEAVAFVQAGPQNLAATITPQHLIYSRNALFEGGLRPHHYCLPVLKRERHRQALLAVVKQGHPRFFLGTDSAPHAREAKESACGCAGVYSAYSAIELYAQVFEQAGCLDKLEAFAGHYGADFYGLPRSEEKIVLQKRAWRLPESLPFADTDIIPLNGGQTCSWQLIDSMVL